MIEGSEFASPKNIAKIYRQKYLQNKRRKEVVFSEKEYSYLEAKALEYKRPVGEFIKLCVFSHLQERYLLHDEALFHALLMEIRRVGTNVNQIARQVNTTGKISLVDSLKLSKRLKDMEYLIKTTLTNPPNMLTELSNAIADPWFMYQVEVLIYNVKMQNDSKNQKLEGSEFQTADTVHQ